MNRQSSKFFPNSSSACHKNSTWVVSTARTLGKGKYIHKVIDEERGRRRRFAIGAVTAVVPIEDSYRLLRMIRRLKISGKGLAILTI